MKKILLIGCGSEIGSNLLILSKKYNFGFDIDTVVNAPIKLDNKFKELNQEDAILSRLRLAYPLEKNDIKKTKNNVIEVYGKETKLIFSDIKKDLFKLKKKKWDGILLATSKEDLKNINLLNNLLKFSKYIFGMAESNQMDSFYPALLGFKSSILKSELSKKSNLIALGSCQTNGWLAQLQVIIRILNNLNNFKIKRVEVDIVHPDTPTGRLGTKSFSPREQDARNNLRPSFSQIDSAMKKLLGTIQAFHTVSLRVLNEEPGYQINRIFFSGDIKKSFINDLEKNIELSCSKSNSVASFDYLPLGSKAYRYRKEIAHILPKPYLKLFTNCFNGKEQIHELITQAYVSNVYGYCYNALKAVKKII